MSDLNRFACTGRLTRDPETRFLAGDKVVCAFSIACSRQFVAGGERKEETIFLDCEAWGKLAEVIGQHMTKGRQCAIDGSLKMDEWQDKATGQKRSKVKVRVDNLTFIGTAPARAEGDAPPPASPSRPATRPRDDAADEHRQQQARDRQQDAREQQASDSGFTDEPPF